MGYQDCRPRKGRQSKVESTGPCEMKLASFAAQFAVRQLLLRLNSRLGEQPRTVLFPQGTKHRKVYELLKTGVQIAFVKLLVHLGLWSGRFVLRLAAQFSFCKFGEHRLVA